MRGRWAIVALAAWSSGCSLLFPFDYGATADAGADVVNDLADAPTVDDAAPPDAGPAPDVVLPCAESTTRCDGLCVDPASSPRHCGGCGRSCPARANATTVCAEGACAFVCSAGFADCDGDATNGCEVDTRGDPAHCGRCTVACAASSNGAASCVAGVCGVTCRMGFGDCNGASADGCEAELAVSPQHCGACGRACAVAHATPDCMSGVCRVLRCEGGFADCDRDPENGCEISVSNDGRNCGACGRTCGAGQGCSAGACVTVCPTGTTNCDGACANLMSDATHCGACATSCPTRRHMTSACVTGTCRSACEAGFADCNGNGSDGCEVELGADPDHCGSCTHPCEYANARAYCASGTCRLRGCLAGFGDCDGLESTGCESNLLTTATSCGACGAVCPALPHASTACRAGSCAIGTCAAGYANCDGARDNGCEVDTQTSSAHCGACGVACEAGSACRAGRCVAVCGVDGLPCCAGDACSGATCVEGTCRGSCGAVGQACCGGSTLVRRCGAWSACALRAPMLCYACGGDGQPCCPLNLCAPGYLCGNGDVCSPG